MTRETTSTTRETATAAADVVVVLDGDTDAGHRLARTLLADGRRVAVIGHHAASVVRSMHGYPAERVLAIAGDVGDQRNWARIVERVTERFGRIDRVVRAEDAALRASA